MTPREFMKRWLEGIKQITPFQQTKVTLIGSILVLVGVIIGLYSTFILKVWWLFIILLGSFFITSMSLVGTYQKYQALKNIQEVINEQKSS